MRRFAAACATAVAMTGMSALAETKTVTGELVTIMCYAGHGEEGRGDKHVACATKCAKEGYPLAVLADDGTLFKVVGRLTDEQNAKLRPLLSKRVVATGEVGEETDGKTIEASSVTPEK